MAETPLVGIIMGSRSDLDVMEQWGAQLAELGVPFELSSPVRTATPTGSRVGVGR